MRKRDREKQGITFLRMKHLSSFFLKRENNFRGSRLACMTEEFRLYLLAIVGSVA